MALGPEQPFPRTLPDDGSAAGGGGVRGPDHLRCMAGARPGRKQKPQNDAEDEDFTEHTAQMRRRSRKQRALPCPSSALLGKPVTRTMRRRCRRWTTRNDAPPTGEATADCKTAVAAPGGQLYAGRMPDCSGNLFLLAYFVPALTEAGAEDRPGGRADPAGRRGVVFAACPGCWKYDFCRC